MYGWIGGRDSHVHYGCRVTNDWAQVADDAIVQDSAGEVVGSLELVAAWLVSGRLRVVQAADVPPEPVTRRIGHDRYREIRRVVISPGLPAERAVWVGRPEFADKPLVLDERGHIVRVGRSRTAALREYAMAGAP